VIMASGEGDSACSREMEQPVLGDRARIEFFEGRGNRSRHALHAKGRAQGRCHFQEIASVQHESSVI